MNAYVVIGREGYYVDEIKKKCPNYNGIDRIPWPLCHADLDSGEILMSEDKKRLSLLLSKLKDLYVPNIFVEDYDYACTYAEICSIINIIVDFFVVKICDCCFDNQTVVEIDNQMFDFVGLDYTNGAYSSIINEKELCDSIEQIPLNENFLFKSFEDARKYINIREQMQTLNGGMGFEVGEDGIDFHLIALYRKRN